MLSPESRSTSRSTHKQPNKALQNTLRVGAIAVVLLAIDKVAEATGTPATPSGAAASIKLGGEPAVTGVVVSPGVNIRFTPELPPAPDGANASYSDANVWKPVKTGQQFVAPFGIERSAANGDIWVGMPIAAGGKLGWVDASKLGAGVTVDDGQPAESVLPTESTGYSLAADQNKLVVLHDGHITGNAPIGHFEAIK